MARLMNGPYPDIAVVRVEGTPYEMGKQHGVQIADLVRAATNPPSSEIRVNSPQMSETHLRGLIEKHRAIVDKLRPEQFEELRGVAEGAGADYTRLVRLFLGRELPYGLSEIQDSASCAAEECTSWGAVAEATREAEPLLAQNRDSPYESGRYRLVIVARPHANYSFVVTGRAGSNDGYGVNEKGLAIMAPAVRSIDSLTALGNGEPPGIQSYTLARMILETCESVEDAVDLVESTPSGYMGLNWLIVDDGNNIVKVERSYRRVSVDLPEDTSSNAGKLMAATNHYSSPEMCSLNSSIDPGTRKRYERIVSLLSSAAGTLNLEKFVQFARDHHHGPGELSICNHGSDSGTNLSMIAEPKEHRLWVLRGSPCLNEYVAYDCP
jgi:hypothetical protein